MDVRLLAPLAKYDNETIRKCLVDPCPNCQEIWRQYQSDPVRFQAQLMEILETIRRKGLPEN